MQVQQSIANLINGVSQQPYALRLPSQCEEQVNAYSRVADGLTKAPPTNHISKLSVTPMVSPKGHLINRDKEEKYQTLVTGDSIKVYDLQGNEKTVHTPNGVGYLSSVDPKTELALITIADYTFILNRTVETQMLNDLSTERDPEALIFVKASAYGTDYKITVDGTEAAFYTTSDTDVGTLQTSHIAESLKTDLETNIGATFDITSVGSVLYLKKTDGTDFDITVEDSVGDTYIHLAKDIVESINALPTKAPEGFTVKVTGAQENTFDDYYIKFTPSSGTDFTEGVWEETVKPGIKWKLDPSTMPHTLVREADGTFTFKQVEWGNREVGDEKTNPERTFVGRKINGMFLFRNRLALLSDESVIFSRGSEFFDYFNSTVLTSVDNDPIDKSAPSNSVSILRHAVAFNKSIILFSDEAQFVIESPDVFAQDTVKIDPMTNFTCSLKASPFNTGKTVLFPTDAGSHSGVKEFYIQQDTFTTDASDVTGHVPRYVPKDVFKIVASSNENISMFLSEATPNRVYIYKYLWQGTEKVQSSWSYFEYPSQCTVVDANFIGSRAYLVKSYPDGTYLEYMDLNDGATDVASTFQYHINRKVSDDDLVVTYDEGTELSTLNLPYTPEGDIIFVTREAPEGQTTDRAAGVLLKPKEYSGTTYVFYGDIRGTRFFAGERYTMKYVFSKQVMRQNSGNGSIAKAFGRLQLLRMVINFADTGFFKTTVTKTRRPPRHKKFTGRRIGSIRAVLGKVSLDSGVFPFAIKGKSKQTDIEITSDSFLPVKLLSAEWEGTYSAKGRST